MATSVQTTLPPLETAILPGDLPEAIQAVELCKNAAAQIHALVQLNDFGSAWQLTKQLHTAMGELQEMARRKSDHERGYRQAMQDAAQRDDVIRQLVAQAEAVGVSVEVTHLLIGGGRA